MPREVKSVHVQCTDCDQYEFTKRFRGQPDTRGDREYEAIDIPDECPVCGSPVETEENHVE